MSFASGFNSGINLAAQLRADARARRQEARQAEMDEKAEKRAKVQDEIAQLRVQSLTQQMKNEQLVREETLKQREMSKIFLGEFNQKSKALDPDDIDGYTNLYAEYRPMMTDPDVLESFNNIHRVKAEAYADRRGNIVTMQKAAREKELGVLANEMVGYYGIDADPTTPQGKSRIMGFKRWKAVNEALNKDNLTWESVEISGDSMNLSEAEFGKAMQKLQGVAMDRSQEENLPAEQRGLIYARRAIDPNAPADEKIEQSRARGLKMSDAVRTEIDDSFTAMGLLIDADRALEDLGIPTGKGVGWFASSLMELAQQDASVADFKAAVQKLIPKLARGVFGEVGVLTDADIDNYKKTVASLAQTPDANKRVMAHTKALIARVNRKKLESLAEEGFNVAQYGKQFGVFKGAPFMVYRSMDSARKNLYGDIYSGTLRPGDKYQVWNDETKSFDTGVAQPLKVYNPNAEE